MISAVRQIGNWLRKKEQSEKLTTLIQEPFKQGKVLLIKIDLDNNRYCGVELEDFDVSKTASYLYRRLSSNGPDCSPTSKLTEAEKTFYKKLLAFFNKHTGSSLLTTIGGLLNSNAEKIMDDINQYNTSLPKKEKNRLLTLKIKHQGSWRYVGDFPEFRNLLIENARAATDKAVAEDKICSLCGEKKSVTGDPRVFTFYTIDKPGFVAGGFNQKTAWKNFPVCEDCKLDLEEGRKFVEQNLVFKFYGFDYWLIPNFIIGTPETRSDIIDILVFSGKNVSLDRRVKRRLTNDEREILDLLKEQQDILTVNLLFLRKENSAERILLLLEDIFPSQIRQIYDAKDAVENIFGEEFTFARIRIFFSKSSEEKRENDLDKYFLTVTESVFKQRQIAPGFLFRFLMPAIRKEFIEDRHFRQRVTDGLMTLLFLIKRSVLKFQEAKDMNQSIFEPLFSRYGPVFGQPAKRGVFLLGALTQLLLNRQYTERKATPFRKYLKGLRMNERDFRELLPRVENKLEEYESFDKGKRLIAAEAARYLLAAGENWDIPSDELNFYFACGMNLYEDVAKILYPKEEQNG
ncbi:MAG: TIGR02556 family CRISPR-associated protein [candidate division WOR-3 bacterium]